MYRTVTLSRTMTNNVLLHNIFCMLNFWKDIVINTRTMNSNYLRFSEKKKRFRFFLLSLTVLSVVLNQALVLNYRYIKFSRFHFFGQVKQEVQHKSVRNERIPVFYNVFTPTEDVMDNVQSIVNEQMNMSLPQHDFFVRSIGIPFKTPNASVLLQHDETGNEVETLDFLWQHCNEYPNDKVVYLHSKGSFHPHAKNHKLRKFLTKGALSEECANLPDTCNVCSSRMSPLPHPHTSGNM